MVILETSAFRNCFQILKYFCEMLTRVPLEHAVHHNWLILIACSVPCRLPTHSSFRLAGAAWASDAEANELRTVEVEATVMTGSAGSASVMRDVVSQGCSLGRCVFLLICISDNVNVSRD